MNDITDSGNRWENAHPAGTDPQGGARAPAEPGGGTVVQERPDLDPGAGQPALAQKPPLRDRLREAPTGAKWAAGSAAAVVALAAVGVGGFAIGRATASHGDTGPGQLGPGGSPGGLPHDDDGEGQGFGAPGGPGGSDSSGSTASGSGSATSSAWYVVPAPAGAEAA
ncbi:hypothetical protein [Nocardioides ungokensis]